MRESKSSASVTKNLQDVLAPFGHNSEGLEGDGIKGCSPHQGKALAGGAMVQSGWRRAEILFQNARYKNGKPDQTNYLSKAESRRNIGDRFGRKIRPHQAPWMENINSDLFR